MSCFQFTKELNSFVPRCLGSATEAFLTTVLPAADPSKDLQQAAGEAAGAPGLLCSPGDPRVAAKGAISGLCREAGFSLSGDELLSAHPLPATFKGQSKME